MVAVLLIEPASTSAWVTVYVAEQLMVAFGASVAGAVGVQVIALRPGMGSVTVRRGRHDAGVLTGERVGDDVTGDDTTVRARGLRQTTRWRWSRR